MLCVCRPITSGCSGNNFSQMVYIYSAIMGRQDSYFMPDFFELMNELFEEMVKHSSSLLSSYQSFKLPFNPDLCKETNELCTKNDGSILPKAELGFIQFSLTGVEFYEIFWVKRMRLSTMLRAVSCALHICFYVTL